MRNPIIILCFLLAGCYSFDKAKIQHGRAVTTYPEIGAEFCASEYPSRDSIVKGDSVIELQIIYEDTGSLKIDTVSGDTVRITRTKVLPQKVIERTITLTDTVYRVNTAEIKACDLERRQALAALSTEQARADRYKGQARKRGMIMWGLIIGLALAAAFWIYSKSKNKRT